MPDITTNYTNKTFRWWLTRDNDWSVMWSNGYLNMRLDSLYRYFPWLFDGPPWEVTDDWLDSLSNGSVKQII